MLSEIPISSMVFALHKQTTGYNQIITNHTSYVLVSFHWKCANYLLQSLRCHRPRACFFLLSHMLIYIKQFLDVQLTEFILFFAIETRPC